MNGISGRSRAESGDDKGGFVAAASRFTEASSSLKFMSAILTYFLSVDSEKLVATSFSDPGHAGSIWKG
jgi:hypothetical protein